MKTLPVRKLFDINKRDLIVVFLANSLSFSSRALSYVVTEEKPCPKLVN